MAAVAAEPGAAAASTTTAGDGAEPEPEIVQPALAQAPLEAEASEERAPGMNLALLPEDGDAAQECSPVTAEAQGRPDREAAGKALAALAGGEQNATGRLGEGEAGAATASTDPEPDPESAGDPSSDAESGESGSAPSVEAANEVSSHSSHACSPPGPSPDSPRAPGSDPAADAQPELASPPRAPGDFHGTDEHLQHRPEPDPTEPTETGGETQAPTEPLTGPQPALEGGAEVAGSESCSGDAPPCADNAGCVKMDPVAETEEPLGTDEGRKPPQAAVVGHDPVQAPASPVADSAPRLPPDPTDLRAPGQQRDAEPPESEPEPKPTGAGGDSVLIRPDCLAHLIPGSEVRVSLDHIIDDALVVSFRLGEKIFSGVLMDLSKRFGPYGIPVTVFPKRDYRDKPEPMQLKTEPFQPEAPDTQDGPSQEPPAAPAAPHPSLWTSKPPPLFQEGAPYPPPLFIRDTYNQPIPQPPPRKIKRPKRKLYREEPTSIMNAIKLRPRQVLCDKCKGAVAGEKREARRGPGAECRGEEAKRRRGESAPAVGKRPRTEPRAEERGRAAEGSRRQAHVVAQARGAGGNRVVKVGPATTTTTAAAAAASSRVQLSTKKVLQSKNVDHSKAREVLKMAKAQKRQRELPGGRANASIAAAGAKTAAPRQDALPKVHFTRRLHQISGGGGGGAGNAAPLPPRIRLKPQRYRNEENDSSSCKPALERVQGGGCRGAPKAAQPVPRCPSTRSSSSLVPAGEAGASSESQGPARGPEPQPRTDPRPQSEPEPLPLPHPEPAEENKDTVAPEERGGDRRERRGGKAADLPAFVALTPGKPDSSDASVCSVDSADDLKSSNSECSSTETFDFPPPGVFHAPSAPSTSSTAPNTTSSSSSSSSTCSSSSASKEDKKLSNSLKATVFSKNVSKCVTPDGRTICVGDIVWAKIYGFPWWPARILAITVSRKDNGLLVRQEARISWFGSPTTSFLALSQLSPFLENFQSRFNKKRKGLYRKAITEAAKAAKQLTPERRDTEGLLIGPRRPREHCHWWGASGGEGGRRGGRSRIPEHAPYLRIRSQTDPAPPPLPPEFPSSGPVCITL
ncbi:PWWP domain-containing protein 2A [Lepisosteus oculatus]|uniref:PWWP domain-containing protein 2A n=1 Tax=Lepisosteus oculatus TaxID=7918 RepID=UPI0035F51E3F